MSIEKLLQIHQQLAEVRAAEKELIAQRGEAIREALDNGHSIKELTAALNVNKQRLYAMIKQRNQ